MNDLNTTWRSIETAPKDRIIDLCGYYPGNNPKIRRVPDCKWDKKLGRWKTPHYDKKGYSRINSNFVPTHWAEVPITPTQTVIDNAGETETIVAIWRDVKKTSMEDIDMRTSDGVL